MLQYLVFLWAFINILWIIPYIRDTLKWVTKPNRVTWLIWWLAPLITAIISFYNWVYLSAIPIFITWILPLLVFFISFFNKNSYWKLWYIDYFCWIFAILSLTLYFITKNVILSISLSILADFFATLPTLIKSWKSPYSETLISYILAFLSFFTSFFAMKSFDFLELAFILYLILMVAILISVIYLRRFFVKNLQDS
jgi:hypothetical protein